MSPGARTRAALLSVAAFGLALAAASPALAATGTPTAPTELFNGDKNCSTDVNAPTYLWGGEGISVEGIPQDTDAAGNPSLTAQFQVWPVADPTQISTLSRTQVRTGFEGQAVVPSQSLTDGQTYAWQAQTVDGGGAASAWSAPCYFAVDNTAPSKAPTVTSPNYPQGQWDQGGVPVQFTLDANGAADVGGFVYGWNNTLPVPVTATIGDYGIPTPVDPYADSAHFARATTVGGSTTVSLIPPTGSGPMTLYVESLDRAFNESAQSSYSFYVSSTGPTITPAVTSPVFDTPTRFTITPNAGVQAASRVLSYAVEVTGGPSPQTVTVQAKADGTAVVTLRLNGLYGNSVTATGTSENGWVSDAGWWSTGAVDTTPTVSSNVYVENGSSGGVGVRSRFTFAPKVKGVASYTYSFNSGPETTVKAGGKGTATVRWTPTENGYYDLEVYATTKDGVVLAPYDYYFYVN
ncbi:hypothetical protein ACEZDB_29985 [Streptacidiphilus sp. N1-3]|uniref:Uncharacterized protein n=1 Tax=Streptacidiphilus alkalitolerans TaxID=3342712 RepID=A0ABV6XAE1_9ACTN